MDNKYLHKLLEDFKNGVIELDDVTNKLKHLPYEELGGFAKIDNHRCLRKGFPEVIFCKGKTVQQIVQIFNKMLEKNNNILLTRANQEIYDALRNVNPECKYHELAKTITLEKDQTVEKKGKIIVLSAGTADIPVAEEAAITAEITGNKVERIYDVGVAGIHRLLAHKENLDSANVIVVVAGMEGALASVVGGLVSKPVIAVPTSIGYGAAFGGIAPLLTMLNSCAPGVSVMNIDNGFGAGYFAGLINK